jgi:hypothetical protein
MSSTSVAQDIVPVQRTSIGMLAGIGVAAVAVIVLLIWWFTRSGPVVAHDVSVLFDIRPWAAIESVVKKPDGATVTIDCPATPCLVSLPPGEYHVRARNPFFTSPIEFDLTVVPGQPQEVRRALPQLNAEEEARRILGER